MSQINPISIKDLPELVSIVAQAFPNMNIVSEEDKQRLADRLNNTLTDPERHLFGFYSQGRLLGGMLLYDFEMNLNSVIIPAGGVGMVAVDMLHRKEHVAKNMISFFLHHYRRRNAPIVLLYPFRPDFYKKMGFGYGPKINQYRIQPSTFPERGSKDHVRFLTKEDTASILSCSNRYANQTHGMVIRFEREIDGILANPSNKVVGYEVEKEILGYLVFNQLVGKNISSNDLMVHEMVFENRDALLGLLAFLRSQSDQFQRVVFNTYDPTFHHLLSDPRNGSNNVIPHVSHESNVQGLGLMYRVVDVKVLFKALHNHNFNSQTCRLNLTLTDTFLPENAGSTIIHFKGGRPYFGSEDYEVAIEIDISEFSSLMMGVIGFKKLYQYSLAQISDTSYLDMIDRLFSTNSEPVCLTKF